MLMPTLQLIDIATQNVVCIDENVSINDAVNLMNEKNHREILITSKDHDYFGLLKANDLIKLRIDHYDFSLPIKSIIYDKVATIDPYCNVEDALAEIDADCQCICLVNNQNQLKGFVTYYDILSCLDPEIVLKKRTINEVLHTVQLKTAQVDEPTLNVIGLINNDVSDSVVIYQDNKAVGILTTKDVIKIFVNHYDLNQPIRNYMSSPLLTVNYNISIHDALAFIKEKHFKRVIVEGEDGEIVGHITQEELIAKVYSRWAQTMKENDNQLKKVNKVLEKRAMKWQELSGTDPLTKIDNRSRFQENLDKHIVEIKRYDLEPFSIVFFDIDHFKLINDTHGHLIGDQVLKEIAQFVKSQLRQSDIFARWGGEEFVIVLLHTSLEQAQTTTENLRAKIAQNRFANLDVTCSFGVSHFDMKDDTDKSILKRADTAMYEAKNSGRNCVKIS